MNRELPSIKLNMLLNGIKGLMGVLFPLITYPYVSSILGVDNLGKYHFSNSIVSYALLVAGLGISTYAVREGAKIRSDRAKINSFVCSMFTINLASTAVSYLLLALALITVPKLFDYRSIIIILSLQIIFRTIGIEWIYSIYEDYLYITIRSIAFQLVSLVLLFVFVKEKTDTNAYALITVFSFGGSNILNFIHSRKYCDIKISLRASIKKHLKPIMILFAMAVTVTVYVSLDTTMLGFMCDDFTVGIYSVSTKIYTIVKAVLSSVLVVAIPRLSAAVGKRDDKEFSNTAVDIFKTLITVVLPSITGIIILRKEIVLLISNASFAQASSSLAILGVALFSCLGAWFWGQCILVPLNRENELFFVTVVSAVANVLLNMVLIPIWKENAAAITTVIAETITMIWCWIKGKDYMKMRLVVGTFLKVVIGCITIVACVELLRLAELNMYIFIAVSIVVSIILYSTIELLLGNTLIKNSVTTLFNKVKNIL